MLTDWRSIAVVVCSDVWATTLRVAKQATVTARKILFSENMVNSLPTVSRDIIAPIIRTSVDAMLARPRRNDHLELAGASRFSLLQGRGYNRCSESHVRFEP